MHESAAAWNRADLNGFLSTYSNDAVFMGNPPTVGLDSIRVRYQRNYFRDGRPRDQLAFDELRTTMLGANHALMTGRCILTNPADNSKTYCRFTLIWERRAEGWKMIHDHSS
jgi:ketosteroid isomerase-like protein